MSHGVSNHRRLVCLLNRLFRGRSKKTSKLRVNGFCLGNSPVTREFPAQMASDAENASVWRRHHVWSTLPIVCALRCYITSPRKQGTLGPLWPNMWIWWPEAHAAGRSLTTILTRNDMLPKTKAYDICGNKNHSRINAVLNKHWRIVASTIQFLTYLTILVTWHERLGVSNHRQLFCLLNLF